MTDGASKAGATRMPLRCLGVVPARGGSRRIPGKNLAALGGRALIDYTAHAARTAGSLVAAVVSTDDAAIARHAVGQGLLNPAMRPAPLAGDASPTVDAVRHALLAYEAAHGEVDAVVVLQPTSPFRTGRHVDEACALFARMGADTVTAVRPAHDHPWWVWRRDGDLIRPWTGEREMTAERGSLPEALAESGAVYVVRRSLILAGRLYGARVVPCPLDDVASTDIDTPADLAWAEFLLARGLAAPLP